MADETLCKDPPVEESITWMQKCREHVGNPRPKLSVRHTNNDKDGSIWNVVRKNIGKNLSQISMPISLNEPLSATQRVCEELEHSHLLDKAATLENIHEQLLYIAAFAVSGYSGSFYRGGRKPFNPLLGETFDYVDVERNFRFVSEQVSHHPPITASFASSPLWELTQQFGAETRFRGTCLKVVPSGQIRLKFVKTGQTFVWQKVSTNVEDIMSGNRWVDHFGTMLIISEATADKATIKFTESSRFKKDKRRNVQCEIKAAASGAKTPPVFSFSGKWNGKLICPELKDRVLFEPRDVSNEDVAEQFGFSPFSCALNDLPSGESAYKSALPITDSRLRPDQRMYEMGVIGANEKKLELEQNQRLRRQEREANGVNHQPMFFSSNETQGWQYSHHYWFHKQQAFESIPSPTLW